MPTPTPDPTHEPSDPLGGSPPDPASSGAIDELLRRVGAAEAPVVLDLSHATNPHPTPAPPPRAPDGEHPRGDWPAFSAMEPEGSFVDERSFMSYSKQPPGGRHLASRRVQGRSTWMLAPGGLALASLVLFIAALVGNLGPEQVADGQGEAAPDTRPAQAAPAAQQGSAPQPAPAEDGQDPAAAQEPAAAQVIAVEKVDGEALGDIATYADGVMACVFRTGHTDAGQGLAEVSIKIKLKNMGPQEVDASTARVELAFAQQSSRATQVEEKGLGAIAPNGGEGIGEWIFRMPADQIHDISVTIAATDGHEPVTFHGASR